MSDTLTPRQRHYCMSRISSKDTTPELLVRKFLREHGWCYRVCPQKFLGKPDIVFRKIKTVIFINGCFWHGHNASFAETNLDGVPDLVDSSCCKIPHTNRKFWLEKIHSNKRRDSRNAREYRRAGWHVITIWSCSLKPKKREATLKRLLNRLNKFAVPANTSSC